MSAKPIKREKSEEKEKSSIQLLLGAFAYDGVNRICCEILNWVGCRYVFELDSSKCFGGRNKNSGKIEWNSWHKRFFFLLLFNLLWLNLGLCLRAFSSHFECFRPLSKEIQHNDHNTKIAYPQLAANFSPKHPPQIASEARTRCTIFIFRQCSMNRRADCGQCAHTYTPIAARYKTHHEPTFYLSAR